MWGGAKCHKAERIIRGRNTGLLEGPQNARWRREWDYIAIEFIKDFPISIAVLTPVLTRELLNLEVDCREVGLVCKAPRSNHRRIATL
jgi:hypothetical protein